MRFYRYFWPVILWAVLILVLTGLPGNYFPVVSSVWDLFAPDKIIHLFIFLVFTALLVFCQIQYSTKDISVSSVALVSIGSGIVFGGITELLQAYVFVWRQASVYDFIADSAGCVSGYMLIKYLLFRRLKSK
jgi:VanZ family protein